MKKIKVLHLLCMNSYSGAENVAITLINSLKDKVDSVYVSPDGSIRKIVEQNGIKHYAIAKVDKKNVKNAINQINPDLIHAHDFTAGTICSMLNVDVPIINHLHNNPPWIRKINVKSVIYGISCFRYKRIITVSNSVMDEFIFGRLFKRKVVVVGNPINLSSIKKRAISKKINDEFDVLFLGRLMPQKNPSLFVEIIYDLTKKIPNIKAAMVGDGDLKFEIEKKIREYGISKNIKLYGFQSNPYSFIDNTKVMCMPSIWEGFGLAAVEGLSFGKPVVASPVGGLKDIVSEKCGKLCSSKEEYTEEIYKLLVDQRYLKEKSSEAIKRASDFDNINDYSEVIMDIYKMVIGEI